MRVFVRSASTAQLDRIRNSVEAGERVALTCYERIPSQCHRGLVTEAVAPATLERGYPTSSVRAMISSWRGPPRSVK